MGRGAGMTMLRLAYVQRFRDRHGSVRHYFRRPGHRLAPLPGLPGSDEFNAAYSAALAASEPVGTIGASRTKAGTVAALVAAYYGSTAFTELSAETQRSRRYVLERFRIEHGDKRIALMQRDNIVRGLDRIGKPHAKRNWLKAIRGLMAYAVAINMRADDPTAGMKLTKVKDSGGFHTWTDDEIATYRANHAIGTRPRLAFELLLETSQRRSDVVRMGPQHISHGKLRIRQKKTGTEVTIPITVELQTAIDATPIGHLSFLVTAKGRPFTAAGFGGYFRECCDAAGLPAHCAAHGLRKAAARLLAEDGATDREIMSITGHQTSNEVTRYTRDADRKRLAEMAMAKRRRGGP
jgi:integrase